MSDMKHLRLIDDDAQGKAEGKAPRRRSRLPTRDRLIPVIPSVVTILAICAGFTGVRFALDGRFDLAVLAILVAAVLDLTDGRLARMLKGTTRFGAELDSLADFLNFGVVPAIILYAWGLGDFKGIGWLIVLIYTVCCALRLARFNTALDEPTDAKASWKDDYFSGVPAPLSAVMVMLPMYLDFQGLLPEGGVYVAAAFCLLISGLMVSRLPVFSYKSLGLGVPRDMLLPFVLITALSAGLLLTFPWIALILFALACFAFLPVSAFMYHKRSRAETRAAKTKTPPHSAG